MREEEEHLVVIRIEMIGDENRTTEIVAEGLVAILIFVRQHSSNLVAFFEVEEISGIEGFVTDVTIAGTMEAPSAALGEYIDNGASTLAVLRLVAILQHLDFGYGIHVQGRIQIGAAARSSRDAIHIHAVVVAASARHGTGRLEGSQRIVALSVFPDTRHNIKQWPNWTPPGA